MHYFSAVFPCEMELVVRFSWSFHRGTHPSRTPKSLARFFSCKACFSLTLSFRFFFDALQPSVGAPRLLPRKVRRVEMPVCRSLFVNRVLQIECLDDGCRAKIEGFLHSFDEFFFRHFGRTERFHRNRNGFSFSDGIGNADLTLVGETGMHEILRNVSCHVCAGAINLRGVSSPPYTARSPQVSTLILRPITPVSPSVPPMLKTPDGLIKIAVSSSNGKGRMPRATHRLQ